MRSSPTEKFIHVKNGSIFVVCNTIEQVLEALHSYEAPMSRYGLNWVTTAEGTSGRDLA